MNPLGNTRKEILVQAEAFSRLGGNELELISRYAAVFRRTITEYEAAHDGEVPSVDHLLSLVSPDPDTRAMAA